VFFQRVIKLQGRHLKLSVTSGRSVNFKGVHEEYLIKPKHFSVCFNYIFQMHLPIQPLFFPWYKAAGVYSWLPSPARSHVKKEWRCTTAPSPSACMAWPRTNLSFIFVFLWFYVYLRWYDCQTQIHDSATPTTNVFHKTAYRLGPYLLFRTVKFFTDCKIHLLDAEGILVKKQVGTTASKILPDRRCWTQPALWRCTA
jgi:hypothetical protein